MDHKPNGNGKSSGRQPAASPLSYHRQQLMHQRHLQRIGGINRLTADLAALQLQEVDPSGPVVPQAPQARQTKDKSNRSLQPQNQQQPALVQGPPIDILDQSTRSKSDGSRDPDRLEQALKDSQETAEDASFLKRYRVNHLIGTGNYARVYKGTFLGNNKELAIKSINLTRTSENYRQKFLPRELSILKRVNHVNICKIYEIIQVADRIFIIMQFCQRGTIADLLQRNQGPLGESVARYLFAPTVDALVYLHSLEIAHRDLKMENILLDNDYVPKVTDFSYSCWLSEPGTHSPLDRTNKTLTLKSFTKHHRTKQQLSMRLNDTFCGTLPYLSPEMIRQFPYDPKKTDTWSLGVCLYVMLNDRLPFPFNDIKLMVKRQLTRDFKFRSSVEASDTCRDLVARLLDPDFSRRVSSVEASQHDWMSGPRERPNR